MKLNNFGFGLSGGGGSDSITGSGTANQLAKFTDVNVIEDSQITDNGTTVSIGGTATSSKALLELLSTTKGILIPRLTTAQINAIVVGAAENSLLVFDTTISKFKFYDHSSTSWKTIESSTIGGETLAQVLTNGRNATGIPIQLHGGGGYLVGTLDGFGAVDVKLRATGTMTLETSKDIVNFKGSQDTLQHNISALNGIGGSSPIVATWQNKSITVAGLDDIANALATYLSLSGGTMSGDINMQFHKLVFTSFNAQIQSGGGLLLTDGVKSMGLEFSAVTGSKTLMFQNASGTIALLSDTTNKLPLAGGTMTGELDMTTNNVAVKTNEIKTAFRLLEWTYSGLGKIIHDFTSVALPGINFTQTWRAKTGTVAHLDDIQNKVLIDDTEITHTGSTTETIMKIIEIPPLEVGDYFECHVTTKKETIIAQMYTKIRVGSSPTISGSTIIDNYNTNNRTHKHSGLYFVKSDTEIMSLFNKLDNNTSAYPNGNNNNILSDLIGAMDRTVTNYIMFTSQLDDASELVTNYFSMVEIKKK